MSDLLSEHRDLIDVREGLLQLNVPQADVPRGAGHSYTLQMCGRLLFQAASFESLEGLHRVPTPFRFQPGEHRLIIDARSIEGEVTKSTTSVTVPAHSPKYAIFGVDCRLTTDHGEVPVQVVRPFELATQLSPSRLQTLLMSCSDTACACSVRG